MTPYFPEKMPPSGESGYRRGGGGPNPVRQKFFRVEGEGVGEEPRGPCSISPPLITEGPFSSQEGGALSKEQRGKGPPGFRTSVANLGLSLRSRMAMIEAQLATSVHPNPGPETRRGRRGTGEENRRMRRERRYERRRRRAGERRSVRAGAGMNVGVNECVIVTWNVQGMSVRENNRERMRRVIDKCVREGWEIVCLTEIRAESEGVIWLGDEECRVVMIHGKRSGIVLRGSAMEKWVEEGQMKWMNERVTAVVLGGMRVVSAYQPVWGTDERGMSEYRNDLENQIAMSGRERLIIGGDFNANVGKGNERRGVCGKYGVGSMNEAGRDLIDWCEEHGLAYVNSFVKHARRGTWFNLRYGRWYELDGFLVRKNERHGMSMIDRMRTLSESGLSDPQA